MNPFAKILLNNKLITLSGVAKFLGITMQSFSNKLYERVRNKLSPEQVRILGTDVPEKLREIANQLEDAAKNYNSQNSDDGQN